eukprot:3255090-Pleurochrysis_carterae.AAC.1
MHTHDACFICRTAPSAFAQSHRQCVQSLLTPRNTLSRADAAPREHHRSSLQRHQAAPPCAHMHPRRRRRPCFPRRN